MKKILLILALVIAPSIAHSDDADLFMAGDTLYVRGEFSDNLPKRVSKIYRKEHFTNINLRSYGGYFLTGFDMFNFIAENNIHVIISKNSACASACAYAAIADPRLEIHGGILAFHFPFVGIGMEYTEKNMRETLSAFKSITYLVILMFREAGYSSNLVTTILSETSQENALVFRNTRELSYYLIDGPYDERPSVFFKSRQGKNPPIVSKDVILEYFGD